MESTLLVGAEGEVYGQSSTYSTARTTATAASTTELTVGQQLVGSTYSCSEGFLSFPLSPSLGGTASGDYVVTGGTLFLTCSANNADTAFDLEVVKKDWGTSLTTGDWVSGASITGDVLFRLSSADFTAGETIEIPVVTALDSDDVTSSGSVRLMLYSSRHKAGTTPTGLEKVTFELDTAYIVVTWYSGDPIGGYFEGAIGPVALWNRELSAAEVEEVMALGTTIRERDLDAGTAVLQGMVRTRSGALVPATHVRAGWWIHNLEANTNRSPRPKPLHISGHSVDLDAGKNALTIGRDWMEEEIGVKTADLLALPASVTEASAAEASASDPYSPESMTTDPAESGTAAESSSSAAEIGTDLSDEYLATHPWMAPSGYWDTHGQQTYYIGRGGLSYATPEEAAKSWET